MNKLLMFSALLVLTLIPFTMAQLQIVGKNPTDRIINLGETTLTSNFNNATANVNDSVCWGGNCNSSSVVLKSGSTSHGSQTTVYPLVAGSFLPAWKCIGQNIGVPFCYTVADASGNIIGNVGAVSGAFLINGFNNADMILSNDALTSTFRLTDSGLFELKATNFTLDISGVNKLVVDSNTIYAKSNWDFGGVYLLNSILALSTSDGLRGIYSPITYDLEPNTGWYRPSQNNQSLQIGGVDQISVNNFTTVVYGNLSVPFDNIVGNGTIRLCPNDMEDDCVSLAKSGGNRININGDGVNLFGFSDNFIFSGAGGKNVSNIQTGNASEFIVHTNLTIGNLTYLNNAHVINGSGQFQSLFNDPYNGTGVAGSRKPVINHQYYDITATTSFDSRYQNTHDRPIIITLTNQAQVGLIGDVAYVILSVDGVPQSKISFSSITASVGVATFDYGELIVQPWSNWSLNSTAGGTGSNKIEHVFKIIL